MRRESSFKLPLRTAMKGALPLQRKNSLGWSKME
jgi:hypothetical protein